MGNDVVGNEQTRYQWVAEQIGERIIRGELAPGERLLEENLASTFQVSRGPVREALRLLERWRLVVILPRRGAMVTVLDAPGVNCLYDVVIPLYELVVRRTAERWTPEQLPPVYQQIERLKHCAEHGDATGYYEANFAFGRVCCTIVDNPLATALLQDAEPELRRVLYRCRQQRERALADHLELMRQLIRQVTDRDGVAAATVVGNIGELERRLAWEVLQ